MPTRSSSLSIPRQDIQAALLECELEQKYIGTNLFPVFGVASPSGYIGRIPLAALRSKPDVKYREKGKANRSTFALEEDSYATLGYKHEEVASDRESRMYRHYFDYETVLGKRAKEIILLNMEYRIAQYIHDTTNLPASGNTGHTAAAYWSSAAALIIDDVHQALRGIRNRGAGQANVLQISWRTWLDMSRNTQILAKLGYSGGAPGGALNPQKLLQAFEGIEAIEIGTAQYNSANEGLAESLTDVWNPQYASVLKVSRTNDIAVPQAGRVMAWQDYGGELQIDMYRDETVEGDVYRAKQDVAEKRLSLECMYLIRGVAA